MLYNEKTKVESIGERNGIMVVLRYHKDGRISIMDCSPNLNKESQDGN